MKKSILVLSMLSIVLITNAQEEKSSGDKKESTFKKENLFVGGDLTLSFGNNFTALGASPYFGYSINRYIDVAASFGYLYTSQRDYLFYGDKVRQTNLGPGAFVRLYPVKWLFAQAQYEHNFITAKYLPAENSGYLQSTEKVDANSLLLGLGYAGGRDDENRSFYYFSISWDVLKNQNSPYVDGLGRTLPVIRAGYNIALFQGNSNRRRR